MESFVCGHRSGFLASSLPRRSSTSSSRSTRPKGIAKFNYRIKWFDGWENHKLNLENYNSGPAAPYNSWALLEKED